MKKLKILVIGLINLILFSSCNPELSEDVNPKDLATQCEVVDALNNVLTDLFKIIDRTNEGKLSKMDKPHFEKLKNKYFELIQYPYPFTEKEWQIKCEKSEDLKIKIQQMKYVNLNLFK